MAPRTSISHEERDGLLNDDDNEIELQDFSAANWNNLQDFTVANWKRAALSLMDSVRPHLQWRFSITRLAWFFVPSFLQGDRMLEQIRPAKLSPTSYLDGMRGVASFIVFFHHLALPCYNWERAWGAEDRYDLILFPFIRLVHAGPAAVSLFFVISGYSLSYRPIKHIRSQNVTDLSTGISSMAFRRVIRLFLPVIFSTGMTFCLIRIGAFDWSRSIATNKTYFRNRFEYHPERLPSIYDQFVEWASVIIGGFQIFDWALYRGFVSMFTLRHFSILHANRNGQYTTLIYGPSPSNFAARSSFSSSPWQPLIFRQNIDSSLSRVPYAIAISITDGTCKHSSRACLSSSGIISGRLISHLLPRLKDEQ